MNLERQSIRLYLRFNRYMVNVNYVKYGTEAEPLLFLIDTWWNVNEIIIIGLSVALLF